MTAYKEISQDYAKTGIKAVALLNGGALVALLTQLTALSGLAGSVLLASVFWTLGVALAAAAWFAGHMAAQCVLVFERDDVDAVLDRAHWWMHFAIASVVAALISFVAGSLWLFIGFYSANSA